MDTYLKPTESHAIDTKDRLRLKGCFRDILNMVNDLNNFKELENNLFDFFMFKSLLREFINKSGGSRGRYLTQGISCSSLKPLRAVPFKVLMVLGLNEESFPALEDPLSFDLKESSFVKDIISIDLSRRTSDKYSFLEVFLSAGEKLFLFYTGKNNVDNEDLQPSALITELEEYLDKSFVLGDGSGYFQSIVEKEKLQPFDSAYFTSSSNIYSYNKRDFKLAQIYYRDIKEKVMKSDFDSIPLDLEDSLLEITLHDLLKFFNNPLKFFFNRSMGIYMEELELLEEDFYENIELDFFEKRTFFKDLVLSDSINENTLKSIGTLIENYCEIQNRRGELINSELSIPYIDKLHDTAKSIVENLKEDNLLAFKPEPSVFTFGDRQDLENGIILSPCFKLEKGVEIKITGSLPPLYIYPDKTVSFVNIISSSKPSISHWILPFLLNKLLPEKITRENGVKAHLVSPKEVFKTRFLKKEIRSLTDLLNSYVNNLRKPIPLYPEIAEMLLDKKEPDGNIINEQLKLKFNEKWIEKDELDFSAYSEFKQCPYRLKAYGGLPHFEMKQLKKFFDSSYKELFQELNNKEQV